MPNKKKLLLVEGEKDKSFFREFCQKLHLRNEITIAPAYEQGGTFNSKQGAINHLPTLVQQMNDGSLERLALVVDADIDENGGGFQRTVQQVAEKIRDCGYNTTPQFLKSGGLVFKHSDGLPDLGLWIMPNNKNEGILEDWISQCISEEEKSLFALAQSTVDRLSDPKFKPIRKMKASVATWLAWQYDPGEGLYYAVQKDLVDEKTPLYKGFGTWINYIFQ